MSTRQDGGPDTGGAADVRCIVNASNQFALECYAELARSSPGNLLFSPSSVAQTFAMVYAGAGRDTEREISEAFHFSLPLERHHSAFERLLRHSIQNEILLRTANRIWGQRGLQYLAEFFDRTERSYGARLAEVDFATRGEQVRVEINDWIAEKTQNQICDFLPPGTLRRDTRLVLTNAVHFLGRWVSEFLPDATRLAPFWAAPAQSRAVPMMRQREHFSYCETSDVQSVEMRYDLPYEYYSEVGQPGSEGVMPRSRGEFSMCVVLPRQKDGLRHVESRLSPSTLRQWLHFDLRAVDLHLPRFRFQSDFELVPTLQNLGVRSAFSENADFSRMTQNPFEVFVSAVKHRAIIRVDETGTEAAAVTAALMLAGCANIDEQPPVEFHADHPFLFLIRDCRTGLIHFLGRVVDPSD